MGNLGMARSVEELLKKGITAVVSAVDPECEYPEGFNHLQLDILDDEEEDISVHFIEVSEFIKTHLLTTNVLVHCAAGMSRSPTLVIAYLILIHHLSYPQAFSLVKTKRSFIRPNPNFQQQL